MTTTVDIHSDTEADFALWAAADPPRAADRLGLLFGSYLADIRQSLAATGGDEAAFGRLGAVRVVGWHPPLYDWPYAAGLWVRFGVRVVRRRFRSPRCRVTVLRVTVERLPPPAA